MIVTTPHIPDDTPHRAYGETIRLRRVGAGVTLRKCAECMGLSMTELSRIEQGRRVMTDAEFDAFNRAVATKGRDYRESVYEADRDEGTP